MEQAAGIVLLLLAVALVIQLIRGGPEAARTWIKAKFLGQTPLGATGSKARARAASSSSSSSGGSALGTVANVLLNPGYGLGAARHLLGG